MSELSSPPITLAVLDYAYAYSLLNTNFEKKALIYRIYINLIE
jgi:hypothetical protein